MKTIVFVLFSLSFLSLKAQDLDAAIPQAEPGKTYATCASPFDTLHKERGVLKVVFPQWESSTDTIFKTSENIQRVVIKSAATQWHFVYADRNCLATASSNCVSLAYVEIPEQTRNIHFTENDSIKIIPIERLTRAASLEWVSPSSIPSMDSFIEIKPYKSSEYKYFKSKERRIIYIYSKSNKWRTWRESLCTCGNYTRSLSSVAKVQEALKQKGYYSDTINNIVDMPTKIALVRFQKEHQLPIGDFNFETLRALGVFPEQHKIFQELNQW